MTGPRRRGAAKKSGYPPLTDINTSKRVRDPCPCCRYFGLLDGPMAVNPLTGENITGAVFRNEVLAMCARCVQAAFLGGTHPHRMATLS